MNPTSKAGKLKKINLVTYSPVREAVFKNLREAIISGKLLPGERLIERDLAEQLGVSRTPVREAIRQLELEGLVTSSASKGMIVSDMSVDDVEEIYHIRGVLEGLAAELAATRARQAHLKELGRIVEQMNQNNGDIEVQNRLNSEFHSVILKAASSPRLANFLSELKVNLERFISMGYSKPFRLPEAIVEHQQILQALQDRDGNRARELMKQHIESSHKAFMESTKQTNEKPLEKSEKSLENPFK